MSDNAIAENPTPPNPLRKNIIANALDLEQRQIYDNMRDLIVAAGHRMKNMPGNTFSESHRLHGLLTKLIERHELVQHMINKELPNGGF